MISWLTYPAVVNPSPRAIIKHCIDPRFAVAMKGFIKHLGYDDERDIVKKFAGGPVALAHPTDMPSRAKWLKKQLEFGCEKFPSIKTLVAIMHEDCAYYHTVPHKCHRLGKERSDLPFIGSFLKHHFPDKKILLYYARFTTEKTEIVFDPVLEFHKMDNVPELSESSHELLLT
ncbi:MAG: hypothetical protein EXS48_00970 [Candidatus Staskawiczbacteria bacterium]|nr:hypothetical protein [Candidatus Staskawiczbacteria bacterium]